MKNEFTIEAPVERVETFVTKQGKDIITLILRIDGEYPKLIPIKFFGHAAESAKICEKDYIVHVNGYLGGREYNGKVYGEMVGTSIRTLERSQKQLPGTMGGPPLPEDDVGF